MTKPTENSVEEKRLSDFKDERTENKLTKQYFETCWDVHRDEPNLESVDGASDFSAIPKNSKGIVQIQVGELRDIVATAYRYGKREASTHNTTWREKIRRMRRTFDSMDTRVGLFKNRCDVRAYNAALDHVLPLLESLEREVREEQKDAEMKGNFSEVEYINAICYALIQRCLETNADTLTIKQEGVSRGGKSCGDWEITVKALTSPDTPSGEGAEDQNQMYNEYGTAQSHKGEL